MPGITAALACGAYAGVPLTHRDHAQSVRIVTAHCGESVDALDWASLAQPRQTLALYMGVAALGTVGERLLAARSRSARRRWRSSRTVRGPTSASRWRRSIDSTTSPRRGAIDSPALLIVGEVAALADKLHWYGEPPRHWQVLRRAA